MKKKKIIHQNKLSTHLNNLKKINYDISKIFDWWNYMWLYD